MGRVYAVVSAKGGVGKTTTAANLAAVLAAAGSRVAVVDGDLGMANLASALGVDVGEVTLHDVLADDSEARSGSGGVDVADAIHEGPHGLSVVPGSPALDAFSRADPERLEGVLDDLAADHDYVILDTGAGLSNDTVAPLTYVDEILLVSTPTRDALGDTDKTRRVAERLGATVAGAALLRADPDDAESDAVVETLDVGVLGTVPDDEVIQRAADAGEPLTTFAPGSRAAAAFASLAAALTGEHVAAPRTDDADAAAEGSPAPSAGPDAVPTGGEADDGAPAAGVGDAPDDSAPDEGDGDEFPADGAPPADERTAAGTVDSDPAPTPDAADSASTREAEESEPTSDAADSASTREAEESEPTPDAADSASTREAEESEPTPGAEDPTPAPDAADSTPDADADPDSPVEPADPEAVAATDEAADADDDGVYATPLEEVPIGEAEGEPPADPVAGVGEAEPASTDADDRVDRDAIDTDAEIDADAGSDGDDDGSTADDDGSTADDDSGGGGFFSRFFG